VNQNEQEALARLRALSRSIGAVHQCLGELLRVADRQSRTGLTAHELRAIGHEFVSLAGDLTKVGVDMALWADELDRTTDSPPPTDDT
jgi:hypothetical protein